MAPTTAAVVSSSRPYSGAPAAFVPSFCGSIVVLVEKNENSGTKLNGDDVRKYLPRRLYSWLHTEESVQSLQ
jgi:hypothetical protein